MPFTDARGRSWPLTMNVNTVRRVKAACGVDLLDLVTLTGSEVKTDTLDRLADDPCLLVDVLFEIVRPAANDCNVTPEAFADALDGDAIEAATVALLEAVIDFFPSAKRRALKAMLAASRRFADKQAEALDKLLNSEELDKAIEAALTQPGG